MKKRMIALFVTASALLALTACGGSGATGSASTAATSAQAASADAVKIVVGANTTPHAEILEQAKPLLAEQGVDLEVVVIEDSVTPNTGVVEGSLDANYFQHVPYMEQWNKENNADLISLGAIHYEPYGIYAGRVASLDALPDGALVAVPNNVTNEARALVLLEQEGLIKLKDGVGINATVNDIEENTKNITFKELAPEQLVQALPDVDVAVINGNYAIEGGLHVKDALAVEANDGLAAQTYGNIIATLPTNKDNEALNKLVEVLQGPEIADYINSTYDGAVVPLEG